MPDWNTLVRERMGSLRVSSEAAREEVIAEIAAHLADLYESEIAAGCPEPQAVEHPLAELGDCRSLVRNIARARHKEGLMNDRSKQFWLPALVSLTASMVWLMILQLAASNILTSWKYEGVWVWPYALWIATLPAIGAATARLSLRAGGRRAARLAAVAFPSIVMAALWSAIVAFLPLRRSPQTIHALSIGIGLLSWVVAPGAALLAGELLRPRRTSATA